MRRLLLPAALVLVAAAVLATSAAAPPSARSAAEARLPSAANPAGRGLAAAAAWLAATGRPARLVSAGDPAPRAGEVWVLAAPGAPLDRAEAEAVLAHAAAGGLVLWALGGTPQPALERALAAWQVRGAVERTTAGLPGHPLLDGLVLRAGPSGAVSSAPGARAVTGPEAPPAATSVPLGRGEVLLLGGPELLDNAHVAEADALSLWVRLAARGPLAFDERFLRPAGAASPLRLPLAAGAQLLLAALVLLVALGRRLGAVRPPPVPGSRRSARDYLESLAALSRRAGAEPALAAGSWRRLRRRLEREAGLPARLPAEAAAELLSRRAPAAAGALRRGEAAAAAPGAGQLLAVTRAAAEVEEALRHGAQPARPGFDSPPAGR